MQTILESLSSPTSLIDAVGLNLQELGTLWGHAVGAEFQQQPEATWFVSGVPFFLLNLGHAYAIYSRDTTSYHRWHTLRLSEYRLPMFWVVDSSYSSDFISDIKARGWKGGPTSVWARDLQTLEEQHTNPEGVSVERVDNSESLDQWIRVFVSGYGGIPEQVFDHTRELLQKHGFVDHPAVHYYLGRLNGEPVTTTLLFLSGGVAGIYNTATLPQARRHGIASAVTHAALLGARTRGYQIATLQATELGVNVYRNLGFEKYGTLNFYFLPGVPKE